MSLPNEFVNAHKNLIATHPEYAAYMRDSIRLDGASSLALAKSARANVTEDAWLEDLNREAYEAYIRLPYAEAERSVLVMRNEEPGFVDVYLTAEDSVHAVSFPYVHFTNLDTAIQSLAVLVVMFMTSEYKYVEFEGETLPFSVLDAKSNEVTLSGYENLGVTASEMTFGQVYDAGRALRGVIARPEEGPSLYLVQLFEDIAYDSI